MAEPGAAPPGKVPRAAPPGKVPRATLPGAGEWQLRGPWAAGVLIGTACLITGLIAGRPDLVVLGAPLLLAAAVALNAEAQPAITVTAEQDRAERAGHCLIVPLKITAGGGLVAVGLSAPGIEPAVYVLDAAETGRNISVELPLSGEREIYALSYAAISADASASQPGQSLPPVRHAVLPSLEALAALPLPARLSGLTGEHPSRTPGDGGELRDIHQFVPGDQLRRIDWRATARNSAHTDQLYVRRTFTTAEANILLLVDTSSDLYSDVSTWFSGAAAPPRMHSSLHLSREAATLVAGSYLSRGDRVGLSELVSYRRGLRAAAGRRQLELIRARLTTMKADRHLDRPSQDLAVPSAALIMVFSAFMNDDGERLLLKWQSLGHRVIGVDTLPQLGLRKLPNAQHLALRMEIMARRDRIRILTDSAVPVFGWHGSDPGLNDPAQYPGALPDQPPLGAGLQMLQRAGAAPRRRSAGGARR